MKKYLFALGAILLSQAGTINAAPYHKYGTVTVDPGKSMTGSMNVAYNETAGSLDYIQSVYSTNTNNVTFWGRSGVANFTCYVSPSNPLHAHAVTTHTGLKNGSILTVKKAPSPSNECNYISSTINSRYLD